MKKFTFLLTAYFLIGATVQAQTPTPRPAFTQGAYEIELYTGLLNISGGWSLSTSGGVTRLQLNTNAGASIPARGRSLLIYRTVSNGVLSTQGLTICVNALPCVFYSSNFSVVWQLPIIIDLTGGYDTVSITSTNYAALIDSFMVLDTAATVFATPTQINTPVPTATAISTWTPGPTITPQPTATPWSGIIVALDPSCKYASTVDGQITCERYEVEPSGVLTAILLFALLIVSIVSLWFNARRIVE
jgi:hypothetical protein